MSREHLAVARGGKLMPGQMKRAKAGSRKLLLCRADDAWHCVDKLGRHEDHSLNFGSIEGRSIQALTARQLRRLHQRAAIAKLVKHDGS